MQQIVAQSGNVILDTETLTTFTSVYLPDGVDRPDTLIELTEAEAVAYIEEHATEVADDTATAEGETKTALEVAQELKADEIKAYDASANVNEFTISGVAMWLTKSERAEMRGLIEAKERAGESTITKMLSGVSVEIPLATATAMLDAILIYADKCQTQTQKHLLAVSELTDVDEVRAYDHTTGYPEKLEFSLG